MEEVIIRHPEMTTENVHEIIQEEIGHVFKEVLMDAGVYKCTAEGRAAFVRFIDAVNYGK